MRKWGGISSRAADAVIMRQKFVGERTARRTPHSTQTLLLGRLLGPVGVYGGASTHTRTRRSRLYMLLDGEHAATSQLRAVRGVVRV